MLPQRDIKNPYSVLIEDIVKLHLAALTEKEMKDSVELFRDQIQSNRVMGFIKDICGLITILEARNALNPQNVDALLYVSKTVNRPNAARRIEDYKKCLLFNQIPPLPPVVHSKEKPTCTKPSFTTNMAVVDPREEEKKRKEELTDKVCFEVANLLGRDVRSFARALFELFRPSFALSESELLNVTSQNQDLQDQTQEVLRLFRKKIPNADHNQAILQALDIIKRGEIRRKIERIILTHHNM